VIDDRLPTKTAGDMVEKACGSAGYLSARRSRDLWQLPGSQIPATPQEHRVARITGLS
jgi:hypothetical protein